MRIRPLQLVLLVAPASLMAAGLARAAAPAAPQSPGDAPSSAPSAPEPDSPPAPTPIEVTVSGAKAEPGSSTFGRREIRDMPGVLGDPYRAIEAHPGVTPAMSGLPYYFIRGAPPGNIGYFFDGIRVPLLFHIGGGPSVIPASVVQRVELHPGPYPASFGGSAGAVVTAESAPPSPSWRGEGAFRFMDLGGVVGGPVGKGADVLAGGHISAGAPLVNLLVQSVALGYADYQARASIKLGERQRLSMLAFGAYDYLALISRRANTKETEVLLDTDFHRIDLRYDREFASGGQMRAAVTLGLDRLRSVGVQSATDWKLAGRVQVIRPIARGRAIVRGGLDVALDGYLVRPREVMCVADTGQPSAPQHGMCPPGTDIGEDDRLDLTFGAIFPSRTDLAIGAWVEAPIALDERSQITPGLRVDHYSSMGHTAFAVDPKLVGRFGVNEHVRLVCAAGIASQLPGFAPLPALQIAGIRGGLQRSVQTSFGAEVSLGPMEFVGALFRQATFNLSDPVGTARGTVLDADRFLTRSQGDAYGLELGARGALSRRMFFLASYTLSRATRTRQGRTVPSAYDRTHIAHLALLYDLGNGWRAGLRHVFYSGFPADEIGGGREPNEHPDRVRPFYRLDARLSKRWKVGQTGYVGLVFDMQNATLSKEVFDVSCSERGCQPREIGPITLPGLAVEGGF